MIELLQSPDKNRVIADGNDTEILLQARQDPDYFVRVKVFINDAAEPFLEQGWSKDENGFCEFNLKHLYHSYFMNDTECTYTTGFHSKEGLFKKVQVVAEEYQIGALVPVASLELPLFYILKNHRPVQFNDELELQFLGLPQENISVDRNTGFIFPLYLRTNELLTVSVRNELNEEIYTEALENFPLQLTQYEINFQDINIAGLEFIYVRFSTSAGAIQKKLVFTDKSLYPPKTIFYLNNYGFYLSACLFGRKEDISTLSPKSYMQKDGTRVTYDVEDTKELELYSGYGYKSVTALIHAIATSTDVRMQLENSWERVESTTKKVIHQVDNQYVYGDALRFDRVNIPSFTNRNTYAMVPEIIDIVATGDENESIEISKAAFLTAYTAIQPATVLQIREVPVNGKISFVDGAGIKELSDLVANNPDILPYSIPLSDFVKFIYEPDQRKDGLPLDEIDFKMGTEVILSNTATINYNVNDIPDTDLPPEIVVNTIKYIALDNSNNGTGQIDATVNVAEGHTATILWEVLGGAPITFNDSSLEDPTLSLSNAQADTTYQVKITATDNVNGLSSSKTVNVNTSSFQVKVEKINYPEQSQSEQVDFKFTGGQPGGQITFKFTVLMYMIVFGGARYVLYKYGLPDEAIKYTGSEDITIDLDGNGEYLLPCQIVNGAFSEVSVEVEIIDAVDPQIIDPNQFKVTEKFSGA
ncbi:hypothetical protein JM79_3250 [Gramella sp. Hel_I_59]|uniref:hypothetical protein n=1 Tax=Gramella sp. Hel_I_59 TaxID=1249978 RepID=UPI0011547EAB|nr:hypothetical protein [Gramella sp. Hel_I_59]TQI69136.1 hypothetical protein JM79_0003 [Gramella sp. Hel_I_59]TQI72292.1 hypothetical protein JM79_3250 [Gramella sp. Hel_I_59]